MECKPCEAAKICNPASGRCVLKSGKIGKELTGGAAAKKSAAAKKPAANAARLTKAEVVASFPNVPEGWAGDARYEDDLAMKGYGPYVTYLTRDIVKMYMGRHVGLVVFHGQGWSDRKPQDRWKELGIIHPMRFGSFGTNNHVIPDDDNLLFLYDGHEEDFIWFDNDIAVTGSGDPVYVFIGTGKAKAPKSVATKTNKNGLINLGDPRCPPGKRWNPKVDKCDAIMTKGKKAPYDHAAAFPNQTRKGVDGQLYVSEKIASGQYRWKLRK